MSRPPRRTQRHRRRRGSGRLSLLLGLFAVIAAGVALLYWTSAPRREIVTDASAPGRLVAEQRTVDLGHVPFDQMAEARFELDNTGGSMVRLAGPPKVRMLEGC